MTQYLYDTDGARVAKGNIMSWSCDTTQNGLTLTSTYILGLNNEQVTDGGQQRREYMEAYECLRRLRRWAHLGISFGDS